MSGDKRRIVLQFSNDELCEDFLAWLADGGGEYKFNEGREDRGEPFARFDFARCFPAWGWDGTHPRVIAVSESDEE